MSMENMNMQQGIWVKGIKPSRRGISVEEDESEGNGDRERTAEGRRRRDDGEKRIGRKTSERWRAMTQYCWGGRY